MGGDVLPPGAQAVGVVKADTLYSLISLGSQLPHKTVDLISQLVIVSNKLTLLRGVDFLKVVDK